MDQDVVEFGIHRKDLYKRQREAYEQEEYGERENRDIITEHGKMGDMWPDCPHGYEWIL